MKLRFRQILPAALAAGISVGLSAAAEAPGLPSGATNVSSAPVTAEVQALPEPVVPTLAYGVADIAKLAHARVSDTVILAYIENSGTVYNLDPGQIVYLRDAGVSEVVLSAMLNQRKKYAELSSQTTPPDQVQASELVAQPVASSATYVAPPPADTAPAPADQPVSTVYVIRYPTVSYGYGFVWPIYHPTLVYPSCVQFRYGYGYQPGPWLYSPGRFGHPYGRSVHRFPDHRGFHR